MMIVVEQSAQQILEFGGALHLRFGWHTWLQYACQLEEG